MLIPTHSILRIELTKRAWKEEQQCLKKMGSLKQLLEAKIQAATKGMDRNGEAETRKKAIQEMQDDMNHNFEEAKEELEKARTLNDTNLFWKLWSREVEKAYLKAIALGNKEAEKMAKGGGAVMIAKKPQQKRKPEDAVRNEWSSKATKCLKQARRVEQLIH